METIEIIKAAVVRVRYRNRILLLCCAKPDKTGWQLPGGQYEPGDIKMRKTAQRELQEETGIEVRSRALKYIGSYYTSNGGKRHKEVDVYEVEVFCDKVVLSDEHVDYVWVVEEQVHLPGWQTAMAGNTYKAITLRPK